MEEDLGGQREVVEGYKYFLPLSPTSAFGESR